MIKTLKQKDN